MVPPLDNRYSLPELLHRILDVQTKDPNVHSVGKLDSYVRVYYRSANVFSTVSKCLARYSLVYNLDNVLRGY